MLLVVVTQHSGVMMMMCLRHQGHTGAAEDVVIGEVVGSNGWGVGGEGGGVVVRSGGVVGGGVQGHVGQMHDPLVDAEDGGLQSAVEALAGGRSPGPGSDRSTAVTTLVSRKGNKGGLGATSDLTESSRIEQK